MSIITPCHCKHMKDESNLCWQSPSFPVVPWIPVPVTTGPHCFSWPVPYGSLWFPMVNHGENPGKTRSLWFPMVNHGGKPNRKPWRLHFPGPPGLQLSLLLDVPNAWPEALLWHSGRFIDVTPPGARTRYEERGTRCIALRYDFRRCLDMLMMVLMMVNDGQ